jgi:hypothetical protein
VSNIVTIEGQTFLQVTSPKYGQFNVKIDSEDAERIGQHTWAVSKRSNGRVYFLNNVTQPNGKNKMVRLHRFVMNAPDVVEVDHVHHDYLDLRKSELRLATNQENMMNRRKHRNSTSTYKGVSFYKQSGKWTSQIQHNGKGINLGYFPPTIDGELAAAVTYDIKAIKLFGEYAKLNFPFLASLRAKLAKNGLIGWTGSHKPLPEAA